MPLSWNEIKSRAVAFSKEWAHTESEEAEAKEFLIELLNVFGITRRRVATFEHKVKKLNEGDGYIDLLWKGMLLVEMKSRGKDLSKAYQQAKDYCHGLKEHELPKLILVSDFHQFVLYNEDGQPRAFTLPELIDNIQLFAPLAGYQKREYKEQDPVNIEAAERMGRLHDKLKAIGYSHWRRTPVLCLIVADVPAVVSLKEQWVWGCIPRNPDEKGEEETSEVLKTSEVCKLKIHHLPYTNHDLTSVRPPASLPARPPLG